MFQPLLYQVATGIISEGEIAPATRAILREQRNAEVLLGDVVHVDLAGHYVISELLGHAYKNEYDTLILAAGAGQSYFGNDHFGYGEQFMGNEGTIEVNSRQFLNFYPEKFGGKPPERVAARKELSISLPGNDNKAVEAHITNFLDAVRGKGKVIAPVEIGQQAAISGHMATLSFKNSKKIIWDEQKASYHFV